MEKSFPKVNQPMTSQMWRSVAAPMGTGIIDRGGGPFLMSIDNATNSMTIKVSSVTNLNEAIVNGFYFQMDRPRTLTLPPKNWVETYWIVLRHDPLKADTEPVELTVITGEKFPEKDGKSYLILYSVTRQPNQVLSQAKIVYYKYKVTPSITTDFEEGLPPAGTVMHGSLARVSETDGLYATTVRLKDEATVWKQITGTQAKAVSMPGWKIETSLGGIAYTPMRNGYLCQIEGMLERTAGGYSISPDEWSTVGTLIPEDLRARDNYGVTSTLEIMQGSASPTFMRVLIEHVSGLMRIRPVGAWAEIPVGARIPFRATWKAWREPTRW